MVAFKSFLLLLSITIVFYSAALATAIRPFSYSGPVAATHGGNVKPAWHAKPLPTLERQPISLQQLGQPQGDQNALRQTGVLEGVMKPAPPQRNDRNPYFEDEIQMQRFQDLRFEEEAQHLGPGGIQRKPIPMQGFNQAQFRKPMPGPMQYNKISPGRKPCF